MILLYQGKGTADTFGQVIGVKSLEVPPDWTQVRSLTTSDLEQGSAYWVQAKDGSLLVKEITISSELIAVQQFVKSMKPKQYTFMTGTAFSPFAGRYVYYIVPSGRSLKVYALTKEQRTSPIVGEASWDIVGEASWD